MQKKIVLAFLRERGTADQVPGLPVAAIPGVRVRARGFGGGCRMAGGQGWGRLGAGSEGCLADGRGLRCAGYESSALGGNVSPLLC